MSRLRGSSLRARLTRTLVGLGLISVILLAAVNFFVVRQLLSRSAEEQLVTLREVRTDQIETGFNGLLIRASAIGADPAVGEALQAIDAGYQTLDEQIPQADLERLEPAYAEATAPYVGAGADVPPFDELLPDSTAGRYVQFHYVTQQDEDRRTVVDAGDGSAYSEAHARFHPYLVDLSESFSGADVLLISAQSNEIVYSVNKRIDLGTDVETGPHSDTSVGEVWERLGATGAGDSVLADSYFYLPASATPTAHVGTVVRAGTEVIGAVLVELPIEVLTDFVSSGGRWELLGLGDTGDAYIVGPDRLLRSIPRAWDEDPVGSLERFRDIGGDERRADLIEFIGSPVLLAPVDNQAVDSSLDGERFTGTVDNQLDRRANTASGPLAVPGLNWVIVAEQQVGESREAQLQFLLAIGVLLAILLPLLAIVGAVLARLFARPVDPLVAAAHDIADGDFTVEVTDLGRNELGDLGRQLTAIAGRLQEQDATIAAEEARITTMLESVVPNTLVEPIRRGELEVADVVDSGTVVALTVRGLPEATSAEQDMVFDVAERLSSEVRALATEHGVERIRVDADQQLFVAGRGIAASEADRAIDFARRAIELVATVGVECGAPITAHVGLAAGSIATGMLGSRRVSFGMWGDCVGRAIELSESAAAGQMLADETVAAEDVDDARFSVLDGAEAQTRSRVDSAYVLDVEEPLATE